MTIGHSASTREIPDSRGPPPDKDGAHPKTMIRRLAVVAGIATLCGRAGVRRPEGQHHHHRRWHEGQVNEYVMDDQRFDANRYTVKSGATVTLRDK